MSLAEENFEYGMKMYRILLETGYQDPIYDHPYLTPTSLVVDVGGYKGDWTAGILSRYSPYVDIFEPVKSFVEHLRRRFAGDNRVSIHPVALEDKHESREITVDEDRSSFFTEGKKETIIVEDIGTYPLGGADLISINAEGSEYRILPRLIETGMVKIYKNIQVQFHYTIPGAYELRERIRNGLNKTHQPVYNFPFVWESWRRKY